MRRVPVLWLGGVALGSAGLALLLQGSGALQVVEWAVLDRWFRSRAPETRSLPVTVIAVTEADIQRLGQWPVSDRNLARMLRQLAAHQPRVIGLDLYRDLPVEPGHAELLETYAALPNLVGIYKVVGDAAGAAVNAPPVLRDRDQIAASDIVLDADGRLRRHLLGLRDETGKPAIALGAKLALMYLAEEGIEQELVQAGESVRLGRALVRRIGPYSGGYVRVDRGGFQILSNFYRSSSPTPVVSLSEVLENRVDPALLRDRVLLIGSMTESLRDRFYTPYTQESRQAWYGVEIHADAVQQLLAAALQGRPLLQGVPEPLEWLWVMAWCLLGTSLGWYGQGWRGGAGSGVAVLALGGSGYGLFWLGWWMVLVPAALGFGLALGLGRAVLVGQRFGRSHRLLQLYSRRLERKVQRRTQALVDQNLALEMAKRTAEQASQTKSTFLAHMSHELRSPLMAILGFSELLQRENLAPQHQEKLAIINRSGEHLLRLVNDVLELARIEAGKWSVRLSYVNLSALLASLDDLFGLQARNRNLELRLERGGDLPDWVQVDEVKLRQILVNLLGNALKFTERGEIVLRVEWRPQEFGEQELGFHVQDTGCGIPAEALTRIFEPFVQVGGSMAARVMHLDPAVSEGTTASVASEQQAIAAEGTGLGLAICRAFAQQMGGTLEVVSHLGQGSTFSLYVPAQVVDRPNLARRRLGYATGTDSLKSGAGGLARAAGTSLAVDTSLAGPIRILVVDDSLVNRKLLGKMMASANYEVLEAGNGKEAIAVWQRSHPHLILMDMQMPVMNGYEAIRAIRQIEAESLGRVGVEGASPQAGLRPGGMRPVLIPVIILGVTANLFDEDAPALLQLGCTDVLCKPFKREEICAKVADLLQHYGMVPPQSQLH